MNWRWIIYKQASYFFYCLFSKLKKTCRQQYFDIMFFKLFCSLKVMMTVWRHTGGQTQHWECYAMFRAQRCWFCTQNQISSGGFTAVLLSVILDYVILFQQKGAAHTHKEKQVCNMTIQPRVPYTLPVVVAFRHWCRISLPSPNWNLNRKGRKCDTDFTSAATGNECANPGIWYCHWYNSQISVLE